MKEYKPWDSYTDDELAGALIRADKEDWSPLAKEICLRWFAEMEEKLNASLINYRIEDK